MMDDAAVFSVLSKCFAPVSESEWKQLTAPHAWDQFLGSVRFILQNGGSFGGDLSQVERARSNHAPLQDFLADGEVNALFCPPTYDEKRQFFARHFTGGLPESALPIESLYTPWDDLDASSPFGAHDGMYMGRSARYMSALVEQLGLSIPPEYSDKPDHLALELDVIAVMLRSGMTSEARTFLRERFAWLTDYRKKLIGLGKEASFFVSLVDVLIGFCAEQAEADSPKGARARR